MKFRTLGMSGLRVSAVGLGCMGMSHAYGKPADKDEMMELLVVHILVEHLVDVGESIGAFQFLCLLVEGGASLAIHGVGTVGVEPCGGGCLLGVK